MENKVVHGIASLTTLTRKDVSSLLSLQTKCIGDYVLKSLLADSDETVVNLEIGKLKILHTSNEIKFKFIPDAKLVEEIKSVILNKRSSIEDEIDKTLVDRITNVYKELL